MSDSRIMAPSSDPARKELDSLLSGEERTSLVVLVNEIMGLMRKHIPTSLDMSTTAAERESGKTIALSREKLPIAKADRKPDQHGTTSNTESGQETEIANSELSELESAATEHFLNWAETVMSRLGTVVNRPVDAVTKSDSDTSANVSPNMSRAHST